jgi:hypothetical protein
MIKAFLLHSTVDKKFVRAVAKVGFCTEKYRLKLSLTNLFDLMKLMQHLSIKEQAFNLTGR